ncbi:hypothetical protein ACN99C_26715 (plasmid) [Pseudomonas alloputida]|uniref:hypothetical protein n=1 Tax=Pseudomonas alloputida TaxID=1940621 RepID=UPI003B436DCC
MSQKIVSDIGPSWCKPLPDTKRWAYEMAQLARSSMKGPIEARVWPYRYPNEYLSVDLFDGKDDLSITIATGFDATDYSFGDLETTCFHVVDMAEALLMATLLINELGATIIMPSRH